MGSINCDRCNAPMLVVERVICRDSRVWLQCSKNKRHPIMWQSMLLDANHKGPIMNKNAYQYGKIAYNI